MSHRVDSQQVDEDPGHPVDHLLPLAAQLRPGEEVDPGDVHNPIREEGTRGPGRRREDEHQRLHLECPLIMWTGDDYHLCFEGIAMLATGVWRIPLLSGQLEEVDGDDEGRGDGEDTEEDEEYLVVELLVPGHLEGAVELIDVNDVEEPTVGDEPGKAILFPCLLLAARPLPAD